MEASTETVVEPVVSGAEVGAAVSTGGSGEVNRMDETTVEEVETADGADWWGGESEKAGMPSPVYGGSWICGVSNGREMGERVMDPRSSVIVQVAG